MLPIALWHYHHADLVVEFSDKTEESRREFIEKEKLPAERALRLRLLKPVKGELPSALLAAHAEYQAADAKYQAAWAEWQAAFATKYHAARAEYQAVDAKYLAAWATKYQAADAEYQAAWATKYQAAEAKYLAARAEYHAARAKYQAAYRDNLAAIKALHKTECPDCPWNGETIFTRKDKNGAWY